MAEPQFFLVRSADLVLLGVSWTGCAVFNGNSLRVVASDATIALTFPPQAFAEGKVQENEETGVRRARLAGPSSVAFRLTLPVGSAIALSADGILGALQSASIIDSAIEIPFGLVMTPAGDIRAEHVSGVLHSGDVDSLWRMPIRSGGAMTYRPLFPRSNDDDLQAAPLDEGQRGQIINAGNADMSRLELTALGGSLTAHQSNSTFEWDHDSALGRDQRVRIENKGVLYPFGHRAAYTEIAERRIEDGAAGLHVTRRLVVTEPVRVGPADGTLQARTFPFDQVEICTTAVTDLLAPNWADFSRPPDALQPLEDELNRIKQEDLPAAVAAYQMVHFPRDRFELGTLSDDLDAVQAKIAELEQILRDNEEELTHIPIDPPPPPPEFVGPEDGSSHK